MYQSGSIFTFFLLFIVFFKSGPQICWSQVATPTRLVNLTFHNITVFQFNRASSVAISADGTSVSLSETHRASKCMSQHPKSKVVAYVIDTGCRVSHQELINRTITIPAPGSPYRTGDDDHGHGTHVAARIAGLNFGLAPFTRIICIKALSRENEGSSTDVVSAIHLAIKLHRHEHRNAAAVMCISLGVAAAQRYKELDRAVTRAANYGIISVVAAGNSARDACQFTPARAPGAIAVAATRQDGTLAKFSNWGRCVTIGAPGVNIWSAVGSDDNAYGVSSGTSMAAPFISGVVSLILSHLGQVSKDFVIDALQSMSHYVDGVWVVSVPGFCHWAKDLNLISHRHIPDDILSIIEPE